jgi:hypothetical protein
MKNNYTLVLKSVNGVGTLNNSKTYFFDWNKIKDAPYKVSFNFQSEGNSISYLNTAHLSTNLGQSKTFNVSSTNNNTNTRILGNLFPRPVNTGNYLITGVEPVYTITNTTTTTNEITVASTSELYIGMSVLLAGTPFGFLSAGTFIIETIPSATTFTLVGVVGLSTATGTMTFQNSVVNNLILNTTKGLKVGQLVVYNYGASQGGVPLGVFTINSILSSSTIILSGLGALTTSATSRMNLSVLNINCLSAMYEDNPSVYLDTKPTNNTLEVKILDKYDVPWLDGIDNDVSNYTLIILLEEL